MTAREDDLVALLAKATPGPWLLEHEPHETVIWTRQPHTGSLASTWDEDINGAFPMRANAALIVAAVNALPDLLAENKALRGRVSALEAERDAAEADARRCREVLRELTDDLEAELRGRYDRMLDHPAMKMRFDRDMDSVTRARALVSERQEGGE